MSNFSAGFGDGFNKKFGIGFINNTNMVGSPYLWLKFDDSSGTTLTDSSGNGRNQTIDGNITNFWKHGKIGNSGYFQASAANKVSMPGNYFSQNGTWCCWINAEWSAMLPGVSRLFNTDDSRGANYEHRFYVNLGYIAWAVANGSGTVQSVISDLSSYDNSWVHIGYTWDYSNPNTDIRGYVNGSNVSGSNTSISGPLITPNLSVDISYWLNYYFNGYIDEFLLYHSALTDEQINLIYQLQK